jgi:hypothetical protein
MADVDNAAEDDEEEEEVLNEGEDLDDVSHLMICTDIG